MCIHLFRCDADPAALAKYVLALAKKEKPESELRGAMCDQLDVFLQQETKGFVDKLFVTLETKSYLQSNPEPPSAKVESTTVAATTTEQVNVGVTNGQNLVIPPVAVPVQPPPTKPSFSLSIRIYIYAPLPCLRSQVNKKQTVAIKRPETGLYYSLLFFTFTNYTRVLPRVLQYIYICVCLSFYDAAPAPVESDGRISLRK